MLFVSLCFLFRINKMQLNLRKQFFTPFNLILVNKSYDRFSTVLSLFLNIRNHYAFVV
jgi:hypothetical protein